MKYKPLDKVRVKDFKSFYYKQEGTILRENKNVPNFYVLEFDKQTIWVGENEIELIQKRHPSTSIFK